LDAISRAGILGGKCLVKTRLARCHPAGNCTGRINVAWRPRGDGGPLHKGAVDGPVLEEDVDSPLSTATPTAAKAVTVTIAEGTSDRLTVQG